jgi:hypothetical protein
MTIDERRKYLRKIRKRYTQAHRKGRGRLLDQMEAVTRLHCISPGLGHATTAMLIWNLAPVRPSK